jgi:hypothetical protein
MMTSKKQTVPVSERALVQRIGRALAKDGEQLRKVRAEGARLELGDYYTLNVSRNFVVQKDVDIEELGRQLQVLRPYESLAKNSEGRK